MSYKPIFSPSAIRPDLSSAQPFGNIIALNFSLHTILLAGATLQAVTTLILPIRTTLLLSTVALLLKGLHTILQCYSIIPNPYLKNVIPGRTTALLPDSSGTLSPGSRKIAILHLGAKSNHPLGIFQPQLGRMNIFASKMNAELEQGKHAGFLGQTMFTRKDERGAIEVINISYWESVESLWEFANSGTHRDAWMWWEKTLKENDCIGINHEIYEAEAKHWENIYINFQPTLQGATTFLRKGNELVGGELKEEWVNPLVDARRGKLAKSSARFGRDDTNFDVNRVGKELYA